MTPGQTWRWCLLLLICTTDQLLNWLLARPLDCNWRLTPLKSWFLRRDSKPLWVEEVWHAIGGHAQEGREQISCDPIGISILILHVLQSSHNTHTFHEHCCTVCFCTLRQRHCMSHVCKSHTGTIVATICCVSTAKLLYNKGTSSWDVIIQRRSVRTASTVATCWYLCKRDY